MINEQQISSFLHFGYLPRVPDDFAEQSWVKHLSEVRVNRSYDEKALIVRGISALQAAFENPGEGMHVIPLSGGLDSRAILANLLDRGLRDQIVTVTFGTPGALDYEIGRKVAIKAGVYHRCFDLTQVMLSQELLEQTVKEGGAWTSVFDAFYNRLICKEFGLDAIYWSGFMGDPLAGSHLLPGDSESWNEALLKFSERNHFSRSCDLTSWDFNPCSVLPSSSILPSSNLSYDEQLDFAIRQQSYVMPIVLPRGYEYRLPFIHPRWINFILSVPRQYREGEYLYKEILKKAYPKLFSLPTKANRGLSLDPPRFRLRLRRLALRAYLYARRHFPAGPWGLYPLTNYIDFDQGFRERNDLKILAYKNLQDLKQRGVSTWIDTESILKRHQSKSANHADVLMLLISLEINLKVAESKQCA